MNENAKKDLIKILKGLLERYVGFLLGPIWFLTILSTINLPAYFGPEGLENYAYFSIHLLIIIAAILSTLFYYDYLRKKYGTTKPFFRNVFWMFHLLFLNNSGYNSFYSLFGITRKSTSKNVLFFCLLVFVIFVIFYTLARLTGA